MTDGLNKEGVAETVIQKDWKRRKEIERAESLPVLSFEGNLVVAKLTSKDSLYRTKGSVVSIEDSNSTITGVITEVSDNNFIKVYSSRVLKNPKTVRKKDWWNIGVALSYLVNDIALLRKEGEDSELEIYFEVPRGTPKFTVKWSLYYSEDGEDYIEIIKGSDWERAGYSRLTLFNYLWKEGYYRIKARRLSVNRLVVVNENSYDLPKKEIVSSSLLVSSLNSIKL